MTKPPLRLVEDQHGGEFSRALPHNIEFEQCLLGAVMLSPAALAEVRPLIDAHTFYRPAHGRIWAAICQLAEAGDPADPLAVARHLGARELNKVGGGPYLHTLITQVPAAANAGYYAHQLRDLAYARAAVQAGTRLVQLGQKAAADDAATLRAAVAAECADLTAPDTRGWPDPTPLSAAPDLPEFPIWVLPTWLGEYAAAVAEVTQTPTDLAGCLALAVLAVAAAGNIWVDAGTWREPTNLFILVVLPPGNRKSEVYKAMTAPIRAAEQLLIDQARPAIAEAMVSRRIAEADAERTEKAAVDAVDLVRQAEALAEAAAARLKLDNQTVTAEPCLFSDDATVQKLATRLAEQGGRFAVLSPEGEIFAIAGGRYDRAPNFAVLKCGHAGEQMRTDRIGRDSERIEAATITLGICTQPGVLARLSDTPEFREQGLLGRILYAVPASLLGYRNPRPDPIPGHLTADYHRNLTALTLSLRPFGDPGQDGDPATLTFAPDAQSAVIEMLGATEPRFRPNGDLVHMTDWGGKLVGATVRIAALLHLAEHLRGGWDRPITASTFDDARQLGDYFTAHAQAAYDTIGADPAVANARALLDWIRRTDTTRFAVRDVLAALRTRFGKVADLNPALAVLETQGWIRTIPGAPSGHRGGRPAAPTYEVHPEATP